MIVGIGLAAALLPVFNELSGSQFVLKDFSSINNLAVFISLVVLAGTVSGCYPALVMANLSLVKIPKRKLKFSGKRMFSKSLVIFQFSLSIILIISSVILRGQLNYMVNTNVGYEREGLLSIRIQRRDDQERFVNLYKNKVVQHSGVLGVSSCEALFGVGFSELSMEKEGSLYQNERRWSEIVKYTSLLAIIIACMGIFGLTAITVNNRVKEIGIRKVLGAKITQVINLIIKDFIILVAAANIIAWPVVFYIMHKVLENYPYRIDIGIHYFLFSGLASSLIAVLTVLWLAVKAAMANPVDSLRYE
jgi:ABC-type antimicrobial peptide transport system permease subunit